MDNTIRALGTGGEGVLNSIIKVYTDMRLEGVYFSGLQVYERVSFSHQKYINGVSFLHPKNIWMGQIWKIVYE